jgi:NADH-quinone oxidoreductase subunit J
MPVSFYLLAVFTIGSAMLAMSLRNLVHCALCLAMAFLGVAAFFLQLNAAFVGFAQILVYVGAVAILIVFAILLTRNSESSNQYKTIGVLPGLSVSILLAFVIILSIVRSGILTSATAQAQAPAAAALGTALLTSHIIPLEFIGLLLTIALLGAVVLALPEKAGETEAAE